jgi:proliferating cell nuclear antigen
MFRISIEDMKNFRAIMKGIEKLVDKVTLDISELEFKLAAIDPTHVVMVDLILHRDWFTELYCTEDQRFSINLPDLNKILGLGGTDTLRLSPELVVNRLHVEFQRDRSSRLFSMKIEDPQDPIPPVNFDPRAKCRLKTTDLDEIIKSTAAVGTYLTIVLSESDLTARTLGDIGDVEVIFSDFLQEVKVKGMQESIYSLEFLTDILSVKSISPEVALEFSSEMPLSLEFPLQPKSRLIYYLSPRVEDEEDEADEDGYSDSPLDFLPSEEPDNEEEPED